jgi:hypothetical protein
MPVTLTRCFACKRPVEVEVPLTFLTAGLKSEAVLGTCADCATREHVVAGGLFIELAEEPRDAIFQLGRIAVTSGAVAALADARQHVAEFLDRHATGDWGRIGHLDRTVVSEQEIAKGELATDRTDKRNKIAVRTLRGQVMSAYSTRKSVELWVLTTLGSHGTAVMLPDEY